MFVVSANVSTSRADALVDYTTGRVVGRVGNVSTLEVRINGQHSDLVALSTQLLAERSLKSFAVAYLQSLPAADRLKLFTETCTDVLNGK